MRSRSAVVLGAAILIFSAGCPNGNPLGLGPTICDRSIAANPPELYTEGTTFDGWYQTSGEDAEWLDWKGGQHYKLQHNLGCCPALVIGYLSFSEHGLGNEDGGFTAPDAEPTSNATIASGDDFSVLQVTPEYIYVANDTCSEFFLRVVAGGGCIPSGGADMNCPLSGGVGKREPRSDAGTDDVDADTSGD